MATKEQEIETPLELPCEVWGCIPAAHTDEDGDIEITCARCGNLL